MNDPKPTEVYRHWKTRDLYCVVGVSRDSEDWDNDDARCVVYFRFGPGSGSGRPGGGPGTPTLIHRPLRMWHEHVERDGYSGPRFIPEGKAKARQEEARPSELVSDECPICHYRNGHEAECPDATPHHLKGGL